MLTSSNKAESANSLRPLEVADNKSLTVADHQDKPNFKDLFNITPNPSLDEPTITKPKTKPLSKLSHMKEPIGDNKEDNDKTKTNKLATGFSKYKHIIVLTLCVVAVLACASLFIYYFVSMRKSKVELLRLTSDCENYKRIADEITSRENNIVSMYETEKGELQDKIVKMEQEIGRLSNERRKITKPKSIMKKQPQKHTTRSSIPNTNSNHMGENRPKVELVEPTDESDGRRPLLEQSESDDEQTQQVYQSESDEEFNVSVPRYDEAPIADKNKLVSPTQQVKNMINKKANNNFKNKMTAIQKANEVVDNYEDEQIEYSTQLGLNKARQINTDKLNDVVAKMERAVDETNDVNQHAIDEDETNTLRALDEDHQQPLNDENTMPIDSLIVN